jgi:crotonobetainyl-CoA:carnitine CoA-transferase CaiB-like acyl-CoA transferase
MPAFGSAGPWAEFRAYGSTIEHSSGLPHLNGRPDDPPTMQHVALGDSIAGLNGVSAILTALIHKQRTGEGQFIDLNQAECLFPLGIHGILEQSVTGKNFKRYGNEHPDFAPHGVYPCKGEDNWILIQVFDESDWSRLKAITNLDFADLKDRIERRSRLDDELSSWTADQDKTKLMNTLQQAGICASVLNNASDLIGDPQLEARQYIQWLEREHVGTIPHPSAPYRAGDEPIKISNPAPTLGQHNELALKDILGLSDAEIIELADQGIIGTKPRLG